MFKELFSNRLFIGALAFFVLCVAGSLLYMNHENQKSAEYAAETEERARQWNEKQKEQPTTETPVVEKSAEVRNSHADGNPWHEGAQAPVADTQAPQTETSQPQEALSPEEQEARRQAVIAAMLEDMPENLALRERNRDTLKRTYERQLKVLKHFEERNAKRGNFWDTSGLKEQVAEAKANLDAQEQDIANLKKWRDEHANK